MKTYVIFFSSLFSHIACATVGGGQSVEFLGYLKDENKVFVLKHYEDESLRIPKLSYFKFKSNTPKKLIDVKSYYRHPSTNKMIESSESEDSHYFFNKLEHLKTRLTKLKKINLNSSIYIQKITQKKVNSYDVGMSYQYNFTYRVDSDDGNYKSNNQNATTFKPCLTLGDSFRIPNTDYLLTTVEYLGLPIEYGYVYEDAVLLKK